MAPKKYYSVKKGFKVGIYDNWNDCKKQVTGFKGAVYKSFPTLEEAQKFLGEGGYDNINTNINTNDITSTVATNQNTISDSYDNKIRVKKNFYAVKVGRQSGIYDNWNDCKKQVICFKGASYKGFVTLEEAQEFLGEGGYVNSNTNTNTNNNNNDTTSTIATNQNTISDSDSYDSKSRVQKKFYAVKVGRQPGIYDNWNDCKEQVMGFKGTCFKSFLTLEEAQNFIKGNVQSQRIEKFYAVKVGHQPGIYDTWEQCKEKIDGYEWPVYKSFASREEAEDFIKGNDQSQRIENFINWKKKEKKNNNNNNNNNNSGSRGSSKKFYAIKKGYVTGIFDQWEECKNYVIGYEGAIYKAFPTLEEAEEYLCDMEPNDDANNNYINNFEDKNLSKIEGENSYSEFINDDTINMDNPEKAVAYVDGSYSINTKEYSYGAIIFYKSQGHHFFKKFNHPEMVKMRNVAGEIEGAKRAMKYCLDNKIPEIDIYYDYKGIENWAMGYWKTNKPGTIQYKQFYDNIKNQVKVNFKKVKAHSNDKYNDIADHLAKKALSM
jgi:ribonuclease HI